MNGHLLLFGPTGAGKSATLVSILMQIMAVYRPRLFIVEAGNSFGLQGDYFATLGLTVNKVQLKPGSGLSLAPFADARRLIERPDRSPACRPRSRMKTLRAATSNAMCWASWRSPPA